MVFGNDVCCVVFVELCDFEVVLVDYVVEVCCGVCGFVVVYVVCIEYGDWDVLVGE